MYQRESQQRLWRNACLQLIPIIDDNDYQLGLQDAYAAILKYPINEILGRIHNIVKSVTDADSPGIDHVNNFILLEGNTPIIKLWNSFVWQSSDIGWDFMSES